MFNSNFTVSKASHTRTCIQMYLMYRNLQRKRCMSKQNLLRSVLVSMLLKKKKLMQQNNRTNEKDVFNIINETITYNLQSICEISSGLSR